MSLQEQTFEDNFGDLINIVRLYSTQGCGTLVTDNEGDIVYVNHKFCQITEYFPEELLGSNPSLLQSGSTPRETYLELWNSISSGRIWQGRLRNVKKSGREYWESISIYPILGRRREIRHFVAVVEEIVGC